MANTPARIKSLLERQQNLMRHITDVLKVKRKYPDFQAPHIAEKSEDYYLGMAQGYNAAVEDALFEHKCYKGFAYQRGVPDEIDGKEYYMTIGPDHPEFAEWRRIYIAS